MGAKVLVLFLLCGNLFASDIFQSAKMMKMATELEEKLLSGKYTEEEIYKAYSFAGREFYRNAKFDLASRYLVKAVARNPNGAKDYSYYFLTRSLIELDKENEAKKHLKDWEFHRKVNKESKRFRPLLALMRAELEKKTAQEVGSNYKDDLGGKRLLENDLKIFIQNGEYKRALDMFSKEDLEDTSIVTQIKYDLLNVLVHKGQVEKLYCQKALDKRPEGTGYSLITCRLLKEYLKTGEVGEEHLVRLKGFLSRFYPQKMYFYVAALSLK